jgi:hypothetical protein
MLTNGPQQRSSRLLLILLFLVSQNLIMLEIISTRLAKIIFLYQQYHAVISLALLGIGLGGTIAFYINRRAPNQLLYIIKWLTLAYSLHMICGFLLIAFLQKTTDPIWVKWFFYSFLSIAYLLGGTITALIFQQKASNIASVYAVSMIGSAIGGILSITLLNAIGNERTLLIIAALGGLANACVPYPIPVKRYHVRQWGMSAFFLLITVLYQFYPHWLTVPCSSHVTSRRTEFTTDIHPVNAQSNAFSYLETYPLEYGSYYMTIDCLGQTIAVDLSQQKTPMDRIAFSAHQFEMGLGLSPYEFKPDIGSALIIGSGAGIEINRFYNQGCPDISAVEINPLIIKITEQLIPAAQNVYHKENVHLFIKEARHYLAQNPSPYDLIYVASGKRYGGMGIRNLLLLENYLFTKEAFTAYLDHLTPTGILLLHDLNAFISRYLNTIIVTLHERNMNPIDHILVIVNKSTSTVLVKNTPWDRQNLPSQPTAGHTSSSSTQKTRKGGILFLKPLDVSTALKSQLITDDRPYLAMATPAWIVPEGRHPFDIDWQITGHLPGISKSIPKTSILQDGPENISLAGKIIVNHLLTFLSIATVVWLITILVSSSCLTHPLPLKGFPLALYFSCLGAGFIVIEMAFIQQFTLFLDNPPYALAVVLSTLLFLSGLGGLWANRREFISTQKIFYLTSGLCLYLFIFIRLINPVIDYYLNAPLFQRILIVIGIMGPPAFLMGMPLPSGLKRVHKAQPSLIPLMWGINGIASVLGGLIALLTAILYGVKGLFTFGIAIYFLAGCLAATDKSGE